MFISDNFILVHLVNVPFVGFWCGALDIFLFRRSLPTTSFGPHGDEQCVRWEFRRILSFSRFLNVRLQQSSIWNKWSCAFRS